MAEPVANASFRAALEKVIDGERVVLARVTARIRVALAFIAFLNGLRLFSSDEWRAHVPTIAVTLPYLVAALVIWRMLETGRLVKRAGWLVPALDMPLVVFAQLMQTSRLPVPWMGLANTPSMMLALVVLSTIALSRSVIVITFFIGLVPILYRAWYNQLALSPTVFMLVGYIGASAGLLAIVTRIRGLIHTSRAQDLLGKYVLGRRIGIGGMAEVFEATYSPEGGFERRVAVKRILPSFADQQVAMSLFRQEAEVGAMLAHPGVVQVLDFGMHQGTSFLAMEFIDGVSLKDLINYQRHIHEPLPIAVVTHIAWQMAEALDYIHGRVSNTGRVLNLVHRDLNPPNIMLTHIGDAKLADFGIALVAGQERMTAAGIMRGKLRYAAPEQLTSTLCDGRADLFALGLTLHECLVGQPVFRAESEVELLKECLEGPLAPRSTSRSDTPTRLDAIIMKLLQRDLALRMPSASELRRELLELPRELLDVQTGRRLLSNLVMKAKEWVAQTAPAVESGSAPLTRTLDDVTRTSQHAAPSRRS